MTPTERTDVTLATVLPEAASKVRQVLNAMTMLGCPMVAYSGLRTLQEQQQLYAQGRTTIGPIVTNCDGVVKRSRHQSGAAIDCAFVVSGATSNDWTLTWNGPWQLYGACAEVVGLRWGGRWKGKLIDHPHVELPNEED